MPKITIGIMGLHESLDRDYGVEEPYREPSRQCGSCITLNKKRLMFAHAHNWDSARLLSQISRYPLQFTPQYFDNVPHGFCSNFMNIKLSKGQAPLTGFGKKTSTCGEILQQVKQITMSLRWYDNSNKNKTQIKTNFNLYLTTVMTVFQPCWQVSYWHGF